MTEALAFIPMWVSAPPIINAIFENLPSKDLNSCAQVCSIWNGVARNIKRRRKLISWFFYKSSFAGQPSFETVFAEHVRNLFIEPSFSLVFGTKARTQWQVNSQTRNKKRQKLPTYPANNTLLKDLPSSCDNLYTISKGITGTTSDCEMTDQLENSEGITAVFFPTLPGIGVHIFKLTGKRHKSSHDQMGIPADKPVKCLLIFSHERSIVRFGNINSDHFLTNYLEEMKGQLAVGGAHVNRVSVRHEKSIVLGQNFGVAFTGDDVSAASIIIPPDVDTTDDVEKKLRVLFDTNILEGQCIAFAFTCVARGESHFGLQNVESDAFRKLFPSIPLFGVFGNGEIGVNYLPNISKPSDWNNRKSISHSYTTIFVVISVKK